MPVLSLQVSLLDFALETQTIPPTTGHVGSSSWNKVEIIRMLQRVTSSTQLTSLLDPDSVSSPTLVPSNSQPCTALGFASHQ